MPTNFLPVQPTSDCCALLCHLLCGQFQTAIQGHQFKTTSSASPLLIVDSRGIWLVHASLSL